MKYILGDKLYIVLKWICLIAIPAVSLFYSTLAPVWGWYNPAAIVATLDAVAVLIGALIGISQATARQVPMDERSPEVDTMPEIEGGIYPLTHEEAVAIFEGENDAD